MKKFLRSLDKNRGFYFATLFVGIIFSGLSVLGPTISGTMISAFLEDASRGMHYLILYLVIGVLQIVFCLWDSYMGKLFKIRQKQLMRDVSFRSFARKDYASREEISSFESFINYYKYVVVFNIIKSFKYLKMISLTYFIILVINQSNQTIKHHII